MILFLTNAYPDFPGSYRGHFVRKLAQEVSESGYRVVVVTPRVFYRSLSVETDPDGIQVFRFVYPSGDRQLLEYKGIPYLRMAVFFLSGLITTIRIAKLQKCRAIHAHWVVPTGFLGAIAGSLLRIPLIVHARGTDMHTYATRNFFMRLITGWTLRRARGLIAASNEIKTLMVEYFHISAGKVNVIPTGIDADLFTPPPRRNQLGPHSKSKKVIHLIYTGGLHPSKGIKYLLNALEPLFRQSVGLHLTLVGEGPLKGKIVKWTRNKGIQKRVSLIGSIPHSEIPQRLHQSHIFILPSLREGTPNSLLEAMACGVPSIATRVGEIPSIINDGEDGLLVNPGSPAELTAKIKLLLEDTAFYERIAKNCRKKALKYDKGQSLQRILDIYRGLSI